MRQKSQQLSNIEIMKEKRQKLNSATDSLCAGIYEWS